MRNRECGKSVLVLVLAFIALIFAGCISSERHFEGKTDVIDNPSAEKRARAILKFNEGTELIASSVDERVGKLLDDKANEAIEAFKAAAQIDPTFAEPHMQLGIIYESVKNDKKTANVHYQKYASIAGASGDRVILDAAGDNKSEEPSKALPDAGKKKDKSAGTPPEGKTKKEPTEPIE